MVVFSSWLVGSDLRVAVKLNCFAVIRNRYDNTFSIAPIYHGILMLSEVSSGGGAWAGTGGGGGETLDEFNLKLLEKPGKKKKKTQCSPVSL